MPPRHNVAQHLDLLHGLLIFLNEDLRHRPTSTPRMPSASAFSASIEPTLRDNGDRRALRGAVHLELPRRTSAGHPHTHLGASTHATNELRHGLWPQ